MSLATRCTSCGTVFRVVQDQLKVSDGWVRCGRCKEVFNASEALFDLGADGAPPASAPAPLSSPGSTALPASLLPPARAPAARPTGPGALGPSLSDGPPAGAPVYRAHEPVQPYVAHTPQVPTALPPGMPWSAPPAAVHHGAAPSAASSTMRFSAPKLRRPSGELPVSAPAPLWPDDQPPPLDQLLQRPAPWSDEAPAAPSAPSAPFVPQRDDEHTHFELPLMVPAVVRQDAPSIEPPATPEPIVAAASMAAEAAAGFPPPTPTPAPPTAPSAPGAPTVPPTIVHAPTAGGLDEPAPSITTSMLAAEAALETPAFVLQPPAAAPARPSASPQAVRNALVAISVVLALALALQVVLHWRRVIAAAAPGLQPVLQALCDGLGCTMEPLRRIEQLVVDSSALTERRQPGEAPSLQLTVSLHNRGPYEVALPLVDLSLTDSRGELLARRSLTPTDFRVASPTLAAGGETTLQLLFSAGDLRVTGYTVEIFYP